MRRTALEIVALGSTALFAGGALYVTLVDAPTLNALPPGEALAYFKRFFPRAAKLQASLAALGAASCLTLYLCGDELLVGTGASGLVEVLGPGPWGVAGAAHSVILAYTAAAIKPVYTSLLRTGATSTDSDAGAVRTRLAVWGEMHAARTAASLVALGAAVYAVVRKE